MEKNAALATLLQHQPDKLAFSLLTCGKVKLAGTDKLFTTDEVRSVLQNDLQCSSSVVMTTMEELDVNKQATVPVTQDMIPAIKKTAENTAVVVDMFEVDYSPETMGASTQAIEKHFDAVDDFVSRMTFPDTTVSDIVVGPKAQVFKKKDNKPTRPDLPQDVSVPTRARASIWTEADASNSQTFSWRKMADVLSLPPYVHWGNSKEIWLVVDSGTLDELQRKYNDAMFIEHPMADRDTTSDMYKVLRSKDSMYIVTDAAFNNYAKKANQLQSWRKMAADIPDAAFNEPAITEEFKAKYPYPSRIADELYNNEDLG